MSTTPLAVAGSPRGDRQRETTRDSPRPARVKNWPVCGAFRDVKRPTWCDEGRTIPGPLTMIALFGGVVGLGGYIRKRRMA